MPFNRQRVTNKRLRKWLKKNLPNYAVDLKKWSDA
jgi:hypothetical protein